MESADNDPPSGPAPRQRRAGVAILVTVGVLIVVAGATIAILLAHRGSDRGAPRPDNRASETPPVVSAYAGDLRQLLLARPATARPAAAPISADGNLALDQAAQITHPEAESRTQLMDFGYQRGAAAQWRDGDVDVTIWLFQFATAGDAQGYRDALDKTFAPEFFDQASASAQFAGGHVYVSQRPLDTRGFLASATAVRGSLLMIVTQYQPTPAVGPITDLAISQYARLPA